MLKASALALPSKAAEMLDSIEKASYKSAQAISNIVQERRQPIPSCRGSQARVGLFQDCALIVSKIISK